MTFNLDALQQIAERTLHNADEFVRKYTDFFVAPPGNTTFQYYDKNGNLVTVTRPNLAKLEKTINDFVANARREYPITPNLLKNTRFFQWPGEIIDSQNPYGTKENQWFDNSLPLFWSWYNYTDSNGITGDTAFKAKTIHVKNTSAWVAEGLPSLDQVPLVNSNGYGAELVRVLVLDISRTKGGTVILAQDCHSSTSWNVGNFTITEKFYFAILSRSGNIEITLPGNRFPTYFIGTQEQGKWHYVTVRRKGFGGCIQGFLKGSGSMKIAILLPFVTFGYLPDDVHIWAGYVGSDATAYSHGDLIVLSSALAKEPW